MELALDRRSADGFCDERRSAVRPAVAISAAGALGRLRDTASPVLDEMVGDGMVTVERVETIADRGSGSPDVS
jgi:hypothetical protein